MKRRSPSINDLQTAKKSKPLQKLEGLIDSALQYVDMAENFTENPPWARLVRWWKSALELMKNNQPFEIDHLKAFTLPTQFEDERFSEERRSMAKTTFTLLNKAIGAVLEEYESQALVEKAKADFPPPSYMCMKENWVERQKKFDDLLCMRPMERTGLPLITLHAIFQKYCQRLRSQTSFTPTHRAIRTASALCKSMGEYFVDEKARAAEVVECLRPLFPGWRKWTIDPPDEPSCGEPDGILNVIEGRRQPFLLMIREGKVELGEGGDVYMQISRDYQMYVKSLDMSVNQDRNFLLHGAPMFLLCVIGPLLFVAGAFFDGRACIIEPLGPALWMMKGATNERESLLARLLQALQEGALELSQLQSSLDTPPCSYPSGVPRVYKTFHCSPNARQEMDASLLFKEARVFTKSSQHHCFTSFTSQTAYPLLMKMVPSSYGNNVHRTLADAGYAPILHGWFQEEGLPLLFVMELLSDDWLTLWDFQFKPEYVNHEESISRAMGDILKILQKHTLVHGDLRNTNIMVQLEDGRPAVCDERAKLKVIDFDWAGDAGQVCYPANRNHEAINWPGPTDEPITHEHDVQIVERWLPNVRVFL